MAFLEQIAEVSEALNVQIILIQRVFLSSEWFYSEEDEQLIAFKAINKSSIKSCWRKHPFTGTHKRCAKNQKGLVSDL